jgi:hypothetical protein
MPNEHGLRLCCLSESVERLAARLQTPGLQNCGCQVPLLCTSPQRGLCEEGPALIATPHPLPPHPTSTVPPTAPPHTPALCRAHRSRPHAGVLYSSVLWRSRLGIRPCTIPIIIVLCRQSSRAYAPSNRHGADAGPQSSRAVMPSSLPSLICLRASQAPGSMHMPSGGRRRALPSATQAQHCRARLCEAGRRAATCEAR